MSEWKIVKVSAEEWINKFSEHCHKIVFNEYKPSFRDRISYALLCIKDEKVIGYVTVREIDDENVYWQFGGVLPQFRRSMTAVKAIEMGLQWQKKHSLRIRTYVENSNIAMLKFYISYGFVVIGTMTFKNRIMIDLLKELHADKQPIREHAKPETYPGPAG